MVKRCGALVAIVVSSGLIAAAAAVPASAAARTTKCSVGSGEGEGYSYLLTLDASGTTCTTAKTVVKHRGVVRGWKCVKKVLQKGKGTYYANETCTDARAKITYEFEQFT